MQSVAVDLTISTGTRVPAKYQVPECRSGPFRLVYTPALTLKFIVSRVIIIITNHRALLYSRFVVKYPRRTTLKVKSLGPLFCEFANKINNSSSVNVSVLLGGELPAGLANHVM